MTGIDAAGAQTVNLNQSAEELHSELYGVKFEFIQVFTTIDAVDVSVAACEKFGATNYPAIQDAAAKWESRNNIAAVRLVLNEYYKIAGQEQLTEKEAIHSSLLAELETGISALPDAICHELTTYLGGEWNLDNESMKSVDVIKDYTQKKLALAAVQTEPFAKVENPSYQSLRSQGFDPVYNVIPTEFHCYAEKPGDSYDKPEFVLQAKSDGTYQSTYGPGRFASDIEGDETQTRDLKWTGALAKHSSSRLYFNNFGQTISFKSLKVTDEYYDYDCFQQGARVKSALVQYQLIDPQDGEYICINNIGTAQPPISLLKNRRYAIGIEEGGYQVDVKSNNSRGLIKFNTGPLEGSNASYFEEKGNGFRTMNFKEVKGYFPAVASTASLKMSCNSVGEPVNQQQYGDNPTPKSANGAGELAGMYADKKWIDPANRSNYDFYFFTSDGYVYTKEPKQGVDEIKCNRTLPNGAPYCSSYTVSGDSIDITSDFRSNRQINRSDLIKVEQKQKTLDGRFWSNAGNTIGICAFSCTSWYDESTFTFSKGGQFQEQTSGQAIGNSSIAGSDVSATEFNYGEKTGDYRIINNTIELRYKNGRVVEHYIAIFDENNFQMNGWSYSPRVD